MSGEGQTGQGGEGSTGGQSLEERLKALEEQNKQLASTNERLLDQSKEWKSKAQKAKEQEEERLKAIEEEKQRELLEKGQYKTLLEQERERAKKLEEEKEEALKAKKTSDETLMEARKLSAFENRLGGKLKNDKYLGFVNTKDIVVDPDTGNIDPSSVDATVKSFLGEHKELVEFGAGKMPNFDGGTANNISQKQWKSMSHKDRLKNLSAAVEADKKRRKRK